jgi:hypothetical protein
VTQTRALGIAAGALALAAVLALLAVDVLHRESALASGDVRYAAGPGQRDPWQASQILPFGSARALLGVNDDLRYRRAVRLFRLSRPRRAALTIGLAPARAEAEAALVSAVAEESNTVRRSELLNLLGVLALARAAADALANPEGLKASVSIFRSALDADPENADAKVNLELVLRATRRQQRTQGRRSTGHPPRGSRAGLGSTGRGY